MNEPFDFSDCRFIRNELKFYTYKDFCKNRIMLKLIYKTLSPNAKIFYKWYVYANIHMDELKKNYIWDYLNDDDDGTELLRHVNRR